jgi:signal transduction histidine kinase
MRPLATKQGTKIELVLPHPSLDAEFDSGQIQQVLTNLIVNAIQSTETGGLVTITLSEVSVRRPGDANAAERPYQKISIRDNGAGISPEDREHIFEPFFTTKDIGDGTGLGLSISHGIVQEHHGWIEVESEPGDGSCFSVYLPASDQTKDTSNE